MKKRIFHIQLVHRSRARESEREDRAHCSRLHHWTEDLIIVHTRPLGETPENSASLVALQCAVSPTLIRPDPLASHHIATRRTRHEVPHLVGKKSRVLLFHRAAPVRIRQGVADRGGYRKDPRLSLGGGESRGLRRHPPSHHGMDVPRIPMDDWRVVHLRLDSRASRWRWRRRRLRCRRRRSLRSRRRRRCRRRTTPVHLHRLI